MYIASRLCASLTITYGSCENNDQNKDLEKQITRRGFNRRENKLSPGPQNQVIGDGETPKIQLQFYIYIYPFSQVHKQVI